MGTETLLIIGVLIVGFYMSWNIGANDVSNAMGTSVGSGALTLKRAVIIAAILEFSGAYFFGSNVSETLQSGVVHPEHFMHDPNVLIMGMFSALLATSLWLQAASYFGWPVSTTHAIVGAILGFGLLVGGVHAVKWVEVGSIALSWVISPGLSALIAYLIFSLTQRKILFALHPIYATKRIAPLLVFIVLATFGTAVGSDAMSHLHMEGALSVLILFALTVGLIGALITHLLLRKARFSSTVPSTGTLRGMQQILGLKKSIRHLKRVRSISSGDTRNVASETISNLEMVIERIQERSELKPKSHSDYRVVEKIFGYLQILTACFVAFAHGANDVANAIGPVASVIKIVMNPNTTTLATPVPSWLLALGGLGIVIGLATWGWRVIETIGRKITELTPSRGFCAEFGAATTILIASRLGMPISTTHCIVGAVFGIGLAKGISALNLRMLRDIVLSWIITIPSSAISCIIIYFIIKGLLGAISFL
ncbi:MAG: inorganic phosphate transporter [Simkaniaceae bacterium]|nr:inorganic phosphate transporter [Simkaniaceae bacterium]